MKKIYYAYEEFRQDSCEIIKRVQEHKLDAVVGVARGGLTLAHALSEGLDIRKVETVRTELYDAECKREEISLFGTCDFQGVQRVLVVDDISDSGKTLQEVCKYLRNTYPNIEFISATLFYKKSSCFEPDIWINEAEAWIEFFWEKDFK